MLTRVGKLRAKAFAGIIACGHGGGTLGRHSTRWGRHVGAPFLVHGGSLGETLSSSWTDDGGAFGVVPFLEASSLETQLGFGNIGLHWSWETAIGGGGMDASLTGLLSSSGGIRRCGGGQGLPHACRWLLAAYRGGRRCLAAVSSVRNSVGGRCLRHRQHGTTRLVADCSGLLNLA